LMGISDTLAKTNKERYISFSTPFSPSNARHALALFKGDVYLGLDATSLAPEDLDFAQDHLRILSGLYGILKPLDLIQAYRLEMGTSLKFRNKKNLYEYWGGAITEAINAELGDDDHIINLASNEYFKVLKPKKLNAPVYNINFKEYKDTKLTFVSFNAKRSRGLMSRWIIQNRINDIRDIYRFNLDRYQFDPAHSDEFNLTFTRTFKKAGS
ncbi:MAG: peroxide stress protein YaaA, partial [Bacteroidia bacterium]|nr:peroxide stress protein YaaA [Bacteroidia bacterium]